MKLKIFYIVLLVAHCTIAQNSLEEILQQYNNESIPYISADEVKSVQDHIVLLDAREKIEYEVSHIKNAKFVGFNTFKISSFTKQNIPKKDTIVVYCSLGVRSEDISEKLKKAGYINVYNLYGGIFEWKNKNYTVVNPKGEITENVHAYSKEWAKWLQKGKKVYSN